jgi:hypothetical protein
MMIPTMKQYTVMKANMYLREENEEIQIQTTACMIEGDNELSAHKSEVELEKVPTK